MLARTATLRAIGGLSDYFLYFEDSTSASGFSSNPPSRIYQRENRAPRRKSGRGRSACDCSFNPPGASSLRGIRSHLTQPDQPWRPSVACSSPVQPGSMRIRALAALAAWAWRCAPWCGGLSRRWSSPWSPPHSRTRPRSATRGRGYRRGPQGSACHVTTLRHRPYRRVNVEGTRLLSPERALSGGANLRSRHTVQE